MATRISFARPLSSTHPAARHAPAAALSTRRASRATKTVLMWGKTVWFPFSRALPSTRTTQHNSAVDSRLRDCPQHVPCITCCRGRLNAVWFLISRTLPSTHPFPRAMSPVFLLTPPRPLSMHHAPRATVAVLTRGETVWFLISRTLPSTHPFPQATSPVFLLTPLRPPSARAMRHVPPRPS